MIDADALLDDIRSHSESYFADDFAREWVDKQPTVDAVPVIRCKDCKHYADDQCDMYADETLGYVHSTQADGYCWVAERKEE